MRADRQYRKKRPGRAAGIIFLLFIVLVLAFLLGRSALSRASAQNVPGDGAGGPPDDYQLVTMENPDLARGDLLLVNRSSPYTSPENDSLTAVFGNKSDSYYVRDKNVRVSKEILGSLNGMLDAFYKATGLKTVNVVSGYRSLEEQRKLYDDSMEKNGPEHTSLYVAEPGNSEHHTGLAVDLSVFHEKAGTSEEFSETGKYAWFTENAWKYGFILRYQDSKTDMTNTAYEPWHYRYVGAAHAWYMKENGLCLEEYIELVRRHPCGGEPLSISFDNEKYEVYYCQGLSVYVPKAHSYTVSGDNAGGFIVTVKLT
jgi:D-alanyl-D-alanine carboxypeptidase